MKIVERFTVGADQAGVAAIEFVKSITHLTQATDILRAGVAVMYDLIGAEYRGYTIILRSNTGAEWSYSPHRPGQATPLGEGDNVYPFPGKPIIPATGGDGDASWQRPA